MRLVQSLLFSSVALLAAGSVFAQTGSGGSDGTITKCPRNLGTLAVAEPQSHILASLGRYSLGSPSIMLRMIAQESGCFTVVERGVAMQNIQQERALASGGQLQGGSNVGGGQLQAADFVMTPAVQFSDDTGGIGAAVGGLLGRMGGVLGHIGGLAGGVKFKEAETTLLVADVRSGIQVASAEGKASKMNFALSGWGWGGYGWASAGGYSKTPEGKLIAASLLENFNKITEKIAGKTSLVQSTSASSQANAAASVQATNTAPVAAPAPPPPATMPAPVAMAVAPGLVGAFTGSFIGDDQGTFNVMVGNNGMISGVGFSSKTNQGFSVSGQVSANGQVSMSSSGQAGSAQFLGIIDPNSGAVVGSWNGAGGPKGSFSGQRAKTSG